MMRNFINRSIFKYYSLALTCITICLLFPSCKRFVESLDINDRLEAYQVFENEATANSAVLGIYTQSRLSLQTLPINPALSAGDVKPYTISPGNINTSFYQHQILPTQSTGLPWSGLYQVIYGCNAAIEGLEKSMNVSTPVKLRLMGEAKFSRSLCYFMLINLFGDVPLVTTTDVKVNSTISRSPVNEVYQLILDDLIFAKANLGRDYSQSSGQRNRANRFAAASLLARVYLFLENWEKAEAEANDVIVSSQYSLLSGAGGIFNKDNSEAILQWSSLATQANQVATTYIYTTTPLLICSTPLLNAFEANDNRKNTWISPKSFSGSQIHIPFKFTSRVAGSNEVNTPLRLSEQYLIRAEVRARQNNFVGAIADINMIRNKHGGLTTPLPVPASLTDMMNIVMRERRVELFTEDIHRWADLKRWGNAGTVLSAEKDITWNSNFSLYPIPLTDIQRNPNLKQNPGYDQVLPVASAKSPVL